MSVNFTVAIENKIVLNYGKYGIPNVFTSYYLRSGLIVDLNNDGKNEFVFTISPYPQVAVPLTVIGDYEGQINLTDKYFPGGGPAVKHSPFIFYIDINSDGANDLIVSDAGLDQPPWTGSKIGVAIRNGSYFNNVSNLIEDTTLRNYYIAVGNFDGKNGVEILLSNQDTRGNGDGSLLVYSEEKFKVFDNPIKNWRSDYLYNSTSISVADFNNDGYDDLLLSGNWVGRSNTIVYGAANGLDGNTINELPTGPFGQDGFVALKERAWNKIISSHETNSTAFDFNHDGREDVFSTAINITHYPPGTMNDAMSPRYGEILANGGNDHTESAYQTLLNLDGKNFKSTIPQNSNLGYKFYFNQQQYDINQDGNPDVIAYYHTVHRVTDPGQLFGTTFFINDGSGAFSLIDGADLFPDLTVAPYLNSDTAGIQYSISSPFLLKAAGSVASNKAEVISGEKSIKGEHSGLDAYTPYLITDSSRLPLTAGGSYKITFKYKIISNAGDGFECVIYSPTAGRKGDWLPSIRIKGSAGDTGEAILTNTLGAYTDYQVRWNIVGKGSIIIDDIKIEVHSSGALVASETAEDATVNPYTWVNVGAIIPVSDNGKQFTGLQLYPSWLGGEYVVKKFTAGSLSKLMPSPIVIRDRQASKSILTQSLNDEIFEFGAVKELTLIDGGAGIDTCVYSENSARYKFSINILGNFNVESDAISDQLKNIERLRFSDKFIAIDINGNAGTTAKILGAVFGKDSVQNKQYVGIGLDLLDKGMDYSTLAGLAVHAAGLTTNDQIVSTLWKNVVGTTASASDKAPFIDLLEHGMTVGDLARLAAETSLNGININLVGLASTGIEYTPVA